MRKRPRPGQIASTFAQIQVDIQAELNTNQACRKAGIGLATSERWKGRQENPYQANKFKFPNSRTRATASSTSSPSWRSTAARRRLIASELGGGFAASPSQRRFCRALGWDRTGLRYSPRTRDEQVALAQRIEELAGEHPRYGYQRIWALLGREGWSVNKKAVHRL